MQRSVFMLVIKILLLTLISGWPKFECLEGRRDSCTEKKICRYITVLNAKQK